MLVQIIWDLITILYLPHDNDPKHSANNTRQRVLYSPPKYFEMPPESPHINPIEHLWDYLDKKIRNHNITSKERLKATLPEE